MKSAAHLSAKVDAGNLLGSGVQALPGPAERKRNRWKIKKKREQGWVWWIHDHTQPLLCRCRFLPAKERKPKIRLRRISSQANGKIKLLGGFFFSRAGRRAGHTARNRAESVRQITAQPVSACFQISMEGRAQNCARRAGGMGQTEKFSRQLHS
jgi:hypothetical protein